MRELVAYHADLAGAAGLELEDGGMAALADGGLVGGDLGAVDVGDVGGESVEARRRSRTR